MPSFREKEDLSKEEMPINVVMLSIAAKDVSLLQADKNGYYKNGVFIEAKLSVVKDDVMYISLEVLFSVLNMANYEMLEKEGFWKTEEVFFEIVKVRPRKTFFNDPEPEKRILEYFRIYCIL